jgi:formate C-acetyltransferase
VALYGVDFLIAERGRTRRARRRHSTEDVIRLREEMAEQMRSLEELKQLGKSYGFDISQAGGQRARGDPVAVLRVPRRDQAAERRGRCRWDACRPSWTSISSATCARARSTRRALRKSSTTFVIKLRLVRFLRAPEYNQLFSGDPVWATASEGGMGDDGRTLVSKSTFRMLHTLYNLGPAPEPNITVFWSTRLPDGFKHFARRSAPTRARSSSRATT